MSRVRILCRVQARYPFNSNDPSSLSFEQGDVIEVLTKLESGWWDGWCNGTRGWFPSNYVEVIEDYEEEDALTIRGLDDDRFSHMGKVPHAYSEGSDMIPSSRNGVPLRKNNEHRLSLPYQEGAMDAYGSRLRKQSQHCDPTNGSSLPPNWTMETTEDGSEFYYYNHVTGEMRSTHPADLSESEFEEDISYGVNGSVDDDDDDDEDDTFDFKSVDSRPWDERSVIDAFEDCTMPEKHTVGWIKRQTPQGRVYYVNSHTQEIVWDLAPADEQNVALPRPSPRSRSRQPSVRKTSVIDANEPLTWNKLSAHIALAIHNLNAAAKNAEKSLFVSSAAGIVNAIRLMLIASGTIDKESPHIKTSSVLRSHHRAMMAAMSKLVLSAQLSAHDTEDNISKMLTDSNDLLLAVRNFVSTCQDIPISVQHMDPRLQQSEKEGEQKSEGETDGPRAKFALQSDLADNLEAYGNSMHESVEAILASIKQGSDQEESRSSMSVVLFTQYRNLANQAAQFIGIIQDIDFHSVDESPLTNQLKAERQLLSDGLGVLFCWMQTMTDENIPLKGVVTEMESAAKQVSEPIRNICSCVSELVRVHKTTSATTTPTVTNAPDTQPVQKETITTALEENKPQTPIKEDTMLGNDGEKTVDSATAADAASENDNKLTHRQSSIKDSASETPSTPAQAGTDTPGSKTNSRKLQRIFGDDAAAAAAVAAAKPTPSDRPWFLQYDYDPSEIVFNMEGNVKGGTLPALVERLTLHDYLDMNFINTFLLTYRSFCTSMELLELLKARYNLTPPDGMTEEEQEIWTQKKLKLVRLRVFNVLKNWLETYYNEDDHVILDPLLEFTNTSIRSTLSFSADQLERLIRLRKDDESGAGLKKMVPSLRDPPEPILPRNRKKFKLMDIDTLEMARQLTIMDFKLYSSIRPVECLDKAWSKDLSEDGGNVAVNIRASIEYCNEVTSWVSDSILSQSDIKKRSNVIKYWVQVAEKCRLLNNFNTCMAVLSAFDNSSVGRLKRTWEMVGARTNQVLSQIRKLMGANRNFTEYRAIIHSINPPCIPFLGIYLQDLTFIEDGNPNYLKKSNNLINFAKRAKTAEVIREIQQYQSSLYQLKPVEELQQFILANLQSTRDEEALYNESLKLEPREREDEKITRLLQESGFL